MGGGEMPVGLLCRLQGQLSNPTGGVSLEWGSFRVKHRAGAVQREEPLTGRITADSPLENRFAGGESKGEFLAGICAGKAWGGEGLGAVHPGGAAFV